MFALLLGQGEAFFEEIGHGDPLRYRKALELLFEVWADLEVKRLVLAVRGAVGGGTIVLATDQSTSPSKRAIPAQLSDQYQNTDFCLSGKPENKKYINRESQK